MNRKETKKQDDSQKPETQKSEATELILSFLNVCNAAINRGDRAWLREVPRKVLARLEGKRLGMKVTKSPFKKDFDFHTIRVKNGHLEYLVHGKQDPAFSFPVMLDYLQDVAENSEKYIDNPLLLDWEWIKKSAENVVKRVAA